MLRFIRTLWTLTKLGLIIALGVYLYLQNGTTTLNIGAYELTAKTGVLLVGLLAVFLVLAMVFSWLGALGRIPAHMRRRRQMRLHKKGLDALASGFGALAAGDGKRARKYAAQAKTQLAQDGVALSTMLDALAARQSGDSVGAEQEFSKLLANKETMSFGLRGLLSVAGEEGQTQRALVLAREAMRQKHADQSELATLIYTLALREKDWAQAEDALATRAKAGEIDKNRARIEQAALKLARAENITEPASALLVAKAALDLDPTNAQAALMVVKFAMARDEFKLVTRAIEQVWPHAPHPELAATWRLLLDKKGIVKPAARIAWLEQLVTLNSRTSYALLELATEYQAQGMVGQAQMALDNAAKLNNTARVLKLKAKMHEQSGKQDAARSDLALALDAGDYEGWVCTTTGRRYSAWQPVVWPDGLVGSVRYAEDVRTITPVMDDTMAPVKPIRAAIGF